MTYLSLNRRWRPRSFSEVTRQEHVTRTLKNAITQGRVAQAYLFGGRRGTGKTTMARILAMGLNCQAHEGPTTEPCGKCPSCESVATSTSPDVIELDAASNRGIDEIRALQENVRLSPMAGRFKVYIIDEAHQMTKEAYNAFLKTLEEPPAHVIFVLATTEPEKILPTVRSRCQRFDFRPVPEPDLVGRLQAVAKGEGIEAPDDLLLEIARKAEGSVRDALGLLEQCVAFAGDQPTVEDFLTVSGGLDLDSLKKLADLVRDGQAAEALTVLDRLIRSGRDPGAIASGLVGYLRDLLLAGLQEARVEAGWTKERLVGFVGLLSRAVAEMRYSSQPRLVLEMALLGLALDLETRPPQPGQGLAPAGTGTGAATAGVAPAGATAAGAAPAPGSPGGAAQMASPPGAGPRAASPSGAGPRAASPPEAGSRATSPPGSAIRGSSADRPTGTSTRELNLEWFRDNWDDLLNRVRKGSVFVRAFLLKARPLSFSNGTLTLGFDGKFHKEQMEEQKNRQVLEEALLEATGANIAVRCRLSDDVPGSAGLTEAPGGERAETRPPAKKLPAPAEPPRSGAGKAPAASGPRRESGPAASGLRRESGPVASGPQRESGPAASGPRPESAPAAPGSDVVKSALTIFGGRVVENEKGSGGPQ